ncbi:hypothetical protein A7D00_6725 [Trichophyton violaceum]|uniref:C2H2-type domain-containing protein n=1 Tax=Trichophyton violaceum TaxID=34388 RepID=A0A178FCG6_TRIVO|nr:hypothetical protein A7D00_6725 [Trichophyton violaceum]
MATKGKATMSKLSIPKRHSQGSRSQSYQSSSAQDFVDIPARTQDDDFSQGDNFSISPGLNGSCQFDNMGNWAISDAMLTCADISTASEATDESFDTQSLSTTDYDMQESQMLTFAPYTQPLFSGSADHTTFSDINPIQDATASCESPQMAFRNSHGFQTVSGAMGFSVKNESGHITSENGHENEKCQMEFDPAHQGMKNSDSLAVSSPWCQSAMSDDTSTGNVVHMSNLYTQIPATPPLTEAGQDIPVTSACSPSNFSPYAGHDDSPFVDTTYLSGQNFPMNGFYPLSPPLSAKDYNRTIRLSKPAKRSSLSTEATGDISEVSDGDMFSTSVLSSRAKDGAETRNPRDHPFYSLPPETDGKYYCPFASREKPCSHTPTTQKCAYHKYLDSHLKPYRCKVPQCVDAHFSSNACLFRHEREAHGMHGHGENPHLCHFPACERSIPGNGFPRRWNLHDHMRRVHDYTSSDKASSPEGSPVTGAAGKKKDSAIRKRKGGSPNSQTMKRVRPVQSQTAAALKLAQAHSGQQLQNAERSYYACLAQLQEELKNINPQDPTLHEKANARLQELHTLSLNYRYIRAGQLANERVSKSS